MKVRRRRSASLARIAPCCATTWVTSSPAFPHCASLSVIFWSIRRCSPRICLTALPLKGKPQPCVGILGEKRSRLPTHLSERLRLQASMFCTHSLFSSQSLSKASRLCLSCSSVQENSASTRSLCGESLSGCTYGNTLKGYIVSMRTVYTAALVRAHYSCVCVHLAEDAP